MLSLQTSKSRQTDVSDSFTVVSSIESFQYDDQNAASVQLQHQVSDNEPMEDEALTDDVQGKDCDLRSLIFASLSL